MAMDTKTVPREALRPAAGSDLASLVGDLVRPEVRELDAYHVPAAEGLVKLDAMENPYPWPGELTERWLETLRGVTANRYPDPEARVVSEALRGAMQVPEGAEILLGNGSDELIQVLLLALAGPDRTVLSNDPGFVMYRLLSRTVGLAYVPVPLRQEDFGLDLPRLLEAIERHRPAVVFLAYPNNPTGNLFAEEDILAVLEAAPGLVVIDEAYAPFAQASFLSRVPRHPNLLVLRTLSKMGLAGLRLGWITGAPAWIRELNKVRLPYNINLLTQVSADFALRHRAVLDRQTERIRESREVLYRTLSGMHGVTVWPSRANFLLLRLASGRADAVFAGLREHRVLVKNLHGSSPALRDCLRVTVGTDEENATFLAALRAVLA